MLLFGGIPFPINYLIGAFLCPLTLPQFYMFVVLLHLSEKLKPLKEFRLLSRVTLHAVLLTVSEFITPQQFPSFAGSGFIVLAPALLCTHSKCRNCDTGPRGRRLANAADALLG